jgi:hypothetical protein
MFMLVPVCENRECWRFYSDGFRPNDIGGGIPTNCISRFNVLVCSECKHEGLYSVVDNPLDMMLVRQETEMYANTAQFVP